MDISFRFGTRRGAVECLNMAVAFEEIIFIYSLWSQSVVLSIATHYTMCTKFTGKQGMKCLDTGTILLNTGRKIYRFFKFFKKNLYNFFA